MQDKLIHAVSVGFLLVTSGIANAGDLPIPEVRLAQSVTSPLEKAKDEEGKLRDAAGALSELKKPPILNTNAPNILLLFADDLGYEALGCYGGLDFQTPHLDQFAAQGMRFTRAYTSPVCTPSRMSLYTGQYVSHHRYDDVLPVHLGTKKAVNFRDQWTTYPQLLRKAGYLTSVTGKWQLAALEFHPEHCRDAGFDSWCVWQIWNKGAKTTRYWDPCFNHNGRVRDDIADRFGPDVLADYVIAQMQTAVSAKRPFYIHHNMLLPHWPITLTPDDKLSGDKSSLANMIRYMDKLCGRILNEVDQLGIADNTVVIFMGDNGTDQKTPRQTTAGKVHGGKTDLNDAGTHIPLLVRQPGVIVAGSVASELIDMVDWFPTMCELAGVPVEGDIDGVSFAQRLKGGKSPKRDFVTGGIHGNLSVFDGNWRIVTGRKEIIDARQLPKETITKTIPDEEAEPITQLKSVISELKK